MFCLASCSLSLVLNAFGSYSIPWYLCVCVVCWSSCSSLLRHVGVWYIMLVSHVSSVEFMVVTSVNNTYSIGWFLFVWQRCVNFGGVG